MTTSEFCHERPRLQENCVVAIYNFLSQMHIKAVYLKVGFMKTNVEGPTS